jgi:hypothetical protein
MPVLPITLSGWQRPFSDDFLVLPSATQTSCIGNQVPGRCLDVILDGYRLISRRRGRSSIMTSIGLSLIATAMRGSDSRRRRAAAMTTKIFSVGPSHRRPSPRRGRLPREHHRRPSITTAASSKEIQTAAPLLLHRRRTRN